MKRASLILLVVSATLTMPDRPAAAQAPAPVNGMFGPRVLGQPLQPQRGPSLFPSDALLQGPAGEFYGIGAHYNGAMFPGQPWQTYGPAAPIPEGPAPPAGVSTPAVLPVENNGVAPQPPDTPPPPDAGGETIPMRSPGAPLGPTSFHAPGLATPYVAYRLSAGSSDSATARAVQEQLMRIPQIARRTPIRVAMIGDTAILRGAVASPHDREMAAAVALLQPGVEHVVNQLRVP